MKEEEKKLRREFYQLEKSYRPYFDFLTENQDDYSEYKGAVTIDGYLNYEPDILFLSYNPAHGKYQDCNKDGAHLVYTGERPFGLFEKGNARKEGRWWETNKPICHKFCASNIDFIYAYQTEINGHSEYGTQKRPAWENEIKIMCLNIYPIATEDCANLINLFKKMKRNHAIPEIESLKDEWEIRKGFIYKMHKFIENFVKPKAILCLGKQTMSDYTWGKFKEEEDGIYKSNEYPNVVGISRSGTWTKRAQYAAKLVADIVKQKNG